MGGGEFVGDVMVPKELTIPVVATTSLPSAPNKGMIYYDVTTNKLVVWTGSAYETITSAT